MTDLNEFSQRVLADQRELDADPTPQTPTYELLAEERLEEAEALARRSVAELDDGHIEDALSPRLVLLSQALIAHGITLARLKKPEAAQAALQRAITMAHRAGAFDKAGLAADYDRRDRAASSQNSTEHLPASRCRNGKRTKPKTTVETNCSCQKTVG